ERRNFAGVSSWSDVAVNLISRDVNEARYGEFASHLEKGERPSDVSLYYGSGLLDAAVDMRFGGEVDDGIATAHCGLRRDGVANGAFTAWIAGRTRIRVDVR